MQSRVVKPTKLVQDCVHLDVVVGLGVSDRIGDDSDSCGSINLRRKEIVHTRPRWSVHQVIGGMLIGPGSPAAGFLDHFENRVHAQKVMWKDATRASLSRISR